MGFSWAVEDIETKMDVQDLEENCGFSFEKGVYSSISLDSIDVMNFEWGVKAVKKSDQIIPPIQELSLLLLHILKRVCSQYVQSVFLFPVRSGDCWKIKRPLLWEKDKKEGTIDFLEEGDVAAVISLDGKRLPMALHTFCDNKRQKVPEWSYLVFYKKGQMFEKLYSNFGTKKEMLDHIIFLFNTQKDKELDFSHEEDSSESFKDGKFSSTWPWYLYLNR